MNDETNWSIFGPELTEHYGLVGGYKNPEIRRRFSKTSYVRSPADFPGYQTHFSANCVPVVRFTFGFFVFLLRDFRFRRPQLKNPPGHATDFLAFTYARPFTQRVRVHFEIRTATVQFERHRFFFKIVFIRTCFFFFFHYQCCSRLLVSSIPIVVQKQY